jgi:hypothetical protein
MILFLFLIKNAFAEEPIMITQSPDINNVIFDGKWTFEKEWKRSSLNTLRYDDGTVIQLRTAHQDNFIYVLVDAVSDTHLDKGSDSAIICIDKNNSKTTVTNIDDYCFMDILDGKNSFVLQGGSPLALVSNFKKIANPDGFIGISTVSDKNDRYSSIPHSSYEFRIPTTLVGRSDNYNFYVGVYDAYLHKTYSWPQGIATDSILKIPSPDKWGDLISPDKSIPEFSWPSLSLLIAIISVLYITRKQLFSN